MFAVDPPDDLSNPWWVETRIAEEGAMTSLSGGCQCGAVRFRIHGTPGESSVCYCRMCQKASASHALILVSVRDNEVEWTRGAPSWFQLVQRRAARFLLRLRHAARLRGARRAGAFGRRARRSRNLPADDRLWRRGQAFLLRFHPVAPRAPHARGCRSGRFPRESGQLPASRPRHGSLAGRMKGNWADRTSLSPLVGEMSRRDRGGYS